MKFSLVAAWACGVVLVACSSDPNAGNGVDDVKRACELQVTWTRADTEACNTCKASVVVDPDCNCQRDDFRGLCHNQVAEAAREADCVYDIDSCVFTCGDDCGCAEACYAEHQACKRVKAALNGCITEVCAEVCD